MCSNQHTKSLLLLILIAPVTDIQSANTEHIPRLIVMSIIVGRRLIGGRVVEMQNNYREGTYVIILDVLMHISCMLGMTRGAILANK